MNAVTYGREKAIRFGVSASLVGVITEPAPGTDSAGKPAVIFLNSGILHRVGSCRIHVRLARALSAQGFTSLRFDYSGIGDSEQRRDSLPFEESAVVETREAMDYLAKLKGTQRFVLGGLCSGADMAHETALKDTRVAGLLMLDAWAYRNTGFYLHHYGKRALQPAVWRNFIKVRLDKLRGRHRALGAAAPVGAGVEIDVPKYVRVFPPRDRVASDLRGFVDRGVSLYCLWTGGLTDYNHCGQYASTFRDVPFKGLLREEHIPDADHILTGLGHQEMVVQGAVDWMNRLVASRPLASASA
ncbi:MAG: alpha/beta fold hydrolase [Gemmatimonadaceae bacterium]